MVEVEAKEVPVAVEVDRSDMEEHPLYTWNRSIPVEKRLEGGADPDVLRKIHEYDPSIRLRWDPKVQLVAIFQVLPGYNPEVDPTQTPVLVCHDEQGAGLIDLGVLERLFLWNMENYGRSYKNLLNVMQQAKKAASLRKKREIWENIDHSLAWKTYQHAMRELDGNPRGLFSCVPDDIKSPMRELSRDIHGLRCEVAGFCLPAEEPKA
jgi:hypothetical protein